MTSQPSTPGPWELDLIYGPEGKPVDAFIDPPGRRRHIARLNTDWLEWEANARLMAAAPDLSDAVRQHLWALEHDDPIELVNSRQSMRLAIAKAEGRQP